MADDYEDDFDKLYGTKYLSADDLKGKRPRHRMISIDVADLRGRDGNTRTRYIVRFDGLTKALPINKTVALALAGAFGKDRRLWVGQPVELYVEPTPVGNGVRLLPLKPGDSMNDAIPF